MLSSFVAGLRDLRRVPVSDAGLFALVMAIVGMMIVPLPTWLLDLLLASNLSLAMLLLITALRVPSGLSFSTLPTVLLITTLYRLALNVSSTRLILLQADAGHVIRAFGEFVVRGNYAVGAIVFLIITLIQYLVVAKGAERIAEVGARFSLDALPGKQLAIDADLRAGVTSPDAARARRATLERESQFYGAMDGAMKFVKGDAIAGCAIALVCFAGGSAIGVFMHGLTWRESARSYGLLTIGDALVSQIPSLVISTAAGLLVTRVAREPERPAPRLASERRELRSLGQDIAAQLFGAPPAVLGTAVFVLALSLVPGLPGTPFALLALLLGWFGLALQRSAPAAQPAEGARPRLLLELGSAPSESERRALAASLAGLGERCAGQLALPIPSAGVVHQEALEPGRYALRLRDAPVLRGLVPDRQHGARIPLLEAELGPGLERHARELLDMQDVQDRLEEHALLARSVVPRAMSLPDLTELLRQLLDEGVSLHAWERILEAIAGSHDRELPGLLTRVRRALRDQISHARLHAGELRVHRVDPLIEDTLREALVGSGADRRLALAPELGRDIVGAARSALGVDFEAVVVTQGELRRALFELLAPELPRVAVLSYDEIPKTLRVREGEPVRV